MATITIDQAKKIAASAYNKLLPADHDYNLNNNAPLFRMIDALVQVGHSPEKALNLMTETVMYYAQAYNVNTFPGHGNPLGSMAATQFSDSLSSNSIVNFLYPEGSQADKQAMVTALDAGQISKTDFATGFLKIDSATSQPTLAQVVKAVNEPGLPVSYPDSGLHVAGVTLEQQDFILAMYASAFGRAAEYNGLKYWAGKLQTELGWGTDQKTAYAVVSKQMYSDGKGNNEGGTSLGDSDYVNYAYQNILGRAGDAGGIVYWNQKLASGEVDRGSFVANFVGDAIGNAGDSDFLQARIAVAKFAAQEHVSGPNAPGIDLAGAIKGVTNAETANAAIKAIIEQYGSASSPKTAEVLSFILSSWADTPADSVLVDAEVMSAEVQLTGVSQSATFDVFAA